MGERKRTIERELFREREKLFRENSEWEREKEKEREREQKIIYI